MNDTKNHYPRMLTIRQTAATGILPEFCLRTMVKRGEVPGFYSGTKYYVNFDRLVAKLDACEGVSI